MIDLIKICLNKGIFYLSESLNYYWPQCFAVLNGIKKPYLNEINENNIAVHIARAFSENNFFIWAEVPIKDQKRRIDLVAYNPIFKSLVYLELKNNIEQPENNLEDIKRLIYISDNGICNEDHGFNHGCIKDAKFEYFGIVNIISGTEFAEWWLFPEKNNFLPIDRQAKTYITLGRILNLTPHKSVITIGEYFSQNYSEQLRFRFRRVSYALFDKGLINSISKVID